MYWIIDIYLEIKFSIPILVHPATVASERAIRTFHGKNHGLAKWKFSASRFLQFKSLKWITTEAKINETIDEIITYFHR